MILVLLLTAMLQQATLQQDRAALLRQAVDEARRELADERKRMAAEEIAHEADLAEAIAERDRLSDRMVDVRLALDARTKEMINARDRRTTKRADTDAAVRDAAEVADLLEQARRSVLELLEILPPSPGRAAQKTEAEDGSAASLFGAMAALLKEGRTSELYRAKVRPPHGTDEEVDLLRIGLISFAYRSGDRVALAMKSPGGEGVYRWREQLAGDVRQSVVDAFDRNGLVPFPLDVTQQMVSESRIRRSFPPYPRINSSPVRSSFSRPPRARRSGAWVRGSTGSPAPRGNIPKGRNPTSRDARITQWCTSPGRTRSHTPSGRTNGSRPRQNGNTPPGAAWIKRHMCGARTRIRATNGWPTSGRASSLRRTRGKTSTTGPRR